MRVPMVRFFGDDRPIEPWEERAAPFVLPFILPLLFGAVLVIWAIGLLSLVAWGAVSPVLPRSCRLDWDTALDLDPTVQSECPVCQARLSLGPVNKQGDILGVTDSGREIVMPAQTAECPACQFRFGRHSLGKIWSPWRECPDA